MSNRDIRREIASHNLAALSLAKKLGAKQKTDMLIELLEHRVAIVNSISSNPENKMYVLGWEDALKYIKESLSEDL